jgi:hypothetical protein
MREGDSHDISDTPCVLRTGLKFRFSGVPKLVHVIQTCSKCKDSFAGVTFFVPVGPLAWSFARLSFVDHCLTRARHGFTRSVDCLDWAMQSVFPNNALV